MPRNATASCHDSSETMAGRAAIHHTGAKMLDINSCALCYCLKQLTFEQQVTAATHLQRLFRGWRQRVINRLNAMKYEIERARARAIEKAWKQARKEIKKTDKGLKGVAKIKWDAKVRMKQVKMRASGEKVKRSEVLEVFAAQRAEVLVAAVNAKYDKRQRRREIKLQRMFFHRTGQFETLVFNEEEEEAEEVGDDFDPDAIVGDDDEDDVAGGDDSTDQRKSTAAGRRASITRSLVAGDELSVGGEPHDPDDATDDALDAEVVEDDMQTRASSVRARQDNAKRSSASKEDRGSDGDSAGAGEARALIDPRTDRQKVRDASTCMSMT